MRLLFITATRIGANRLAYKLQKDGVEAAAIHSDRSQLERMQALAEFKEGKIGILVATDIAARGLDIEELPFVVNFDVPLNPEDYIHRIGRTGRAGSTGEAITLMGEEDREKLSAIERLINRKFVIEKAGAVGHARHPTSKTRSTRASPCASGTARCSARMTRSPAR